MNAKIVAQLETAYRAVEELTGSDIEARRIYIATDQWQAVVVCVERDASERRFEWLQGCRIVWLRPDVADAGDKAPEGDVLHLDASFGHACSTRACLHCGCTDTTACQHADGSPCFWIQPGLCSVCAESFGVDIEAHRAFGAEADIHHAITGVARGELPR